MSSVNLATTFLTAWLCTAAEDRGILPAASFKRARFGVGNVPALVLSDWRDCSLQHYGLFAWLRDAKDGRAIREGTVQMLIMEEGNIVELYQLKITKGVSELCAENAQQQAECMLRKLRLCVAGLPERNTVAHVVIRTTNSSSFELKHSVQGVGRDVGRLDLGSWHVAGYVWYLPRRP
ncbi:HORMA domain containing protein [Gracilaria domingensis]|nr:HORMA domain containing protein [Gracilaria domingensis]